jgi:hypothetical protein
VFVVNDLISVRAAKSLRFQVLMVMGMNMTVFWDMVPCSLIDVDRYFRGVYCLHHQDSDGGSTHL